MQGKIETTLGGFPPLLLEFNWSWRSASFSVLIHWRSALAAKKTEDSRRPMRGQKVKLQQNDIKPSKFRNYDFSGCLGCKYFLSHFFPFRPPHGPIGHFGLKRSNVSPHPGLSPRGRLVSPVCPTLVGLNTAPAGGGGSSTASPADIASVNGGTGLLSSGGVASHPSFFLFIFFHR